MQIFIYKDGSFKFFFTHKEAALGQALLSAIKPSNEESEENLKRYISILSFIEKYGCIPTERTSNVIPFIPRNPPE